MSNSFFQFKQFIIHQDRCAMKVTTDACLFGAWMAADIQQTQNSKTLLDIGTGTGLLTLMIAQKNLHLDIDAIEIDSAAAEQSKENRNASTWKNRVNVIHDDVRSFKPVKKYDLIISNPPFYENELQSGNKQRDTAHHSKHLTMDNLLQIIKLNLVEDGNFYLLLPYKRKDEIEKLVVDNNLTIVKKICIRQSVNHDYFRIIIKGGLKNSPVKEEKEISIRDNEQKYTNDFIGLLKDYYLHL